MTVTIELPEDSVCLHMVLVQHNIDYTATGMYQIDPRKETRVSLDGTLPKPPKEKQT